MSKLEVQNICKSYDGKMVVQPISFTVEDGQLFFLLGPSGCGKSTLLRIIAGLLAPDSGKILLDGKDITYLAADKRNTPMVFQNYSLWPHLSVYENIAFGLRLRKISRKEIDTKVQHILATVEMSEYIERMPGSLSGGQQQRVALARALAMEPPLILFDEPLSNLDAKLRDSMREEIRRICRKLALTAIYVTHDRKEALSMADRVAVLHTGGILHQIADPRTIYCHPATKFVASFLGDVNFIEGVLTGSNDEFLTFLTPLGQLQTARTADGFVPEKNQTATLMFRPENLTFDSAHTQEKNIFECAITDNIFLGETTQRKLEKNGIHLTASESGSRERSTGTLCGIGIAPEHITVLKE